MMTKDKDKDKEEVVPQQSVEATQETNTEVNPYAGWISSMGDTYAQQMAEKEAAEARYKEAIDKMHNARANNRSAMYALLEEQKPTYDYDREKRERNKATIKALGDVLSAVTAGAHAYGKNGAGVVPTLASNSPYKEIEKINTMQEEYRKRNEAWKALDVKMRADEENAKVSAAEALATASGKDLEDAMADLNATREAVNKGMLEIGKGERKEQGANARAVMREEAANARAMYNAQNKAEDRVEEEVSDDEILSIVDHLYGEQSYDEVSTSQRPIIDIAGNAKEGTITTTNTKKRNRHKLSKDEKASIAASYREDPLVLLYLVDPEEAGKIASQTVLTKGGKQELAYEKLRELYEASK